MKKIISLGTAIIVTLSAVMFSSAFAERDIQVLLNGAELGFEVPPQIINNHTFVPMRAIFEALGATVEWNENTRTVTATSGGIVVEMQIDNPVITVNRESITLAAPPAIADGRTLVPVRAVAESLTAEVAWNAELRIVTITSKSEPEPTTVGDGYMRYTNEMFGWSIVIPDDWNVYDRLGNEVIFYQEDRDNHITVSVYRPNEGNPQSSVNREIERMRNLYGSSTIRLRHTVGASAFTDYYMGQVINFIYSDDFGLSFTERVFVFNAHFLRFVVRFHTKTDMDFEKIINSFEARNIGRNLGHEYSEGFVRTYIHEDEIFDITLPKRWEITNLGDDKYLFSNKIDGLEMQFEILNIYAMYREQDPRLEEWFGRGTNLFIRTPHLGHSSIDAGNLAVALYRRRFLGIQEDGVNPETGQPIFTTGGAPGRRAVTVPTPNILNLQGTVSVELYIFDIGERISSDTDDVKRIKICYVWAYGNWLFIVTAALNDNYPYAALRDLYKDIITAELVTSIIYYQTPPGVRGRR